ncbi:MAG: flagellar motor protein MotB [Candidatus Polarisedimenticolaceae bacterium]|nr:flagellar motor protein MotB [Candidatus Polarisedimenticolaceae bacterium]
MPDMQECPPCEEGLPPWLATFADLMSLLMCFFVLLLSFAEMDAVRFKKMADSMKDAFGVQREIPASEIVKGISVVKMEFTPGKPEPTLLKEIKQMTTDDMSQNLDVDQDKKDEMEANEEPDINEELMAAMLRKMAEQADKTAEELKEDLAEEIEKGMVEVEHDETRVIIRIQEKGSFGSGSDQPHPEFFDVMDKISVVVASQEGEIVVAGHTDDIPISTLRFRSNWELSTARAVTVVHALLRHPNVDMGRVKIEGYADTQPIVPNDSAENRARNRRVELVLEQGQHIDSGKEIQATKKTSG